MPSTYIPKPDARCALFGREFYTQAKPWWSDHGMEAAPMDRLQAAVGGFSAALEALVAARAAEAAATQAKDAARKELEEAIRPVARVIQAAPDTTNTVRASMGLSPRLGPVERLPAPATAPRILVEPAGRYTHELRLTDSATPDRTRRPRGADRAELFLALTPVGAPAPADEASYRYIGSTSDGATTMRFEATQGGLQAHYLARWVARRGATGPWSAVASETVAA